MSGGSLPIAQEFPSKSELLGGKPELEPSRGGAAGRPSRAVQGPRGGPERNTRVLSATAVALYGCFGNVEAGQVHTTCGPAPRSRRCTDSSSPAGRLREIQTSGMA